MSRDRAANWQRAFMDSFYVFTSNYLFYLYMRETRMQTVNRRLKNGTRYSNFRTSVVLLSVPTKFLVVLLNVWAAYQEQDSVI